MKDNHKLGVILMAEDDSDDRLLIQDAVAECQWEGSLKFVENGEELMDYLFRRGKYSNLNGANRPGVILLDLNMPKKDGREALRELKADPELRRIPVVVLTTSKADTDVDGLYQLGASSFISKPVQFDALVKVIRVLSEYWFKTVELPSAK